MDTIEQCRWIKSGEEISIGDIKIKRGNFYYGKGIELSPHLIDKISSDKNELSITVNPKIDYTLRFSNCKIVYKRFACYEDMSLYMRYLYIHWLADDISLDDFDDWECGQSLLRFYLYGCEIRIFIDPTTSNKDIEYIINDLIELCIKNKTYFDLPRNKDLRNYLREIIDFAVSKLEYPITEQFVYKFFDTLYVSNDFIPVKYNYVLPSLFHKYYVAENTFLAKRQYWPEDKSYYCISNTTKYFRLRYVCNVCSVKNYSLCNALNPVKWQIYKLFGEYNRIAETNGPHNLYSIFALPMCIDITSEQSVQDLIAWLNKCSERQGAVIVNIDDFLMQTECPKNGGGKIIYAEYIDLIINGFNRLGYSIVPNYKLLGKKLNYGNMMFVYKYNREEESCVKYCISSIPTSLHAQYELLLQATVIMQVSIFVCQSDCITTKDIKFIHEWIFNLNISLTDKEYLYYLFQWQLNKNISLNDFKVGFVNLFDSYDRLETVIGMLCGLCVKQGLINNIRLRLLEKILAMTGIEKNHVHEMILALFESEKELPTLKKEDDDTKNYYMIYNSL